RQRISPGKAGWGGRRQAQEVSWQKGGGPARPPRREQGELMRHAKLLLRASLFTLVALGGVACGAVKGNKGKEETQKADSSGGAKKPDVVFVPTPQEVVEKMLEVAKVTKKDVVYDLGCGDGRIVCTAARKYGCKATGFDIDPDRIKDSEASKKK